MPNHYPELNPPKEKILRIVFGTFLGRLEPTGKKSEIKPPSVLKDFSALFSPSIVKVETILKDSLDLIPSPSVKIQIMGGKVCLRCKGKTLLGILFSKVCLHQSAMFFLITSSNLSHP